MSEYTFEEIRVTGYRVEELDIEVPDIAMLSYDSSGLTTWWSDGFAPFSQAENILAIHRYEFAIYMDNIFKKTAKFFEGVYTNIVLGGQTATGLMNYVSGNGNTVEVKIDSLSLDVKMNEIGVGTTTPSLSEFISEKTAPGIYKYESSWFGYSTYEDNWFTGKFIGGFTMDSEGVLTRNSDNSWTFSGNVWAAAPDVYDANVGMNRPGNNEFWTEVLGYIPGNEYKIEITGQIPIYFEGN